ncbi:MAG: hypothetical protein ABIT01_09970, partial [Thermoanaerobaculia bacterium]
MSERAGVDKSETVKNLFRDLVDRSRVLREDVMRENESLRHRIHELESDLETAESFLSKEFDETRRE